MKEFPSSVNRAFSASYYSQKSSFSGLADKSNLFDSTNSKLLSTSGAKGAESLQMGFFDCFAEIFFSFLASNQLVGSFDSASFTVQCSKTKCSKEQVIQEDGLIEVNFRGSERALFNFSDQASFILGDGSTKFSAQNNVAPSPKALFSELGSAKQAKFSSVLRDATEPKLTSFLTSATEFPKVPLYHFEDVGNNEPTNQQDILRFLTENHVSACEAKDLDFLTDHRSSSLQSLKEDPIEALKEDKKLATQETFEHQPSRFKIESQQFDDIKRGELKLLELSQINLSVKSYQRNSQSNYSYLNSFKNSLAGSSQESSIHSLIEDGLYNDADNFRRGQNHHWDLSTEVAGFGDSYDAAVSDAGTVEFVNSSSQTQTSFLQMLKDKIVDLAQSNQGRIFVSLEIFDEPLSLVILSNKGELRLNFRTKSSSIESKLLGVSSSLKDYLKSKGILVSEFSVNDTVAFRYEEKISFPDLDHFLQESELE